MTNINARITGLSAQQVQAAKAHGDVNIVPDSSQKTVKDIVRENVVTYFNFIFLVLSILLVLAGAFRSLTILGVAIFNSLIGIVQQLRAKKVLDGLSILNAVKIDVIRDGKASKVSTEELVLGDVVIFRSGTQICADATVLDGEISVNESLLTGESDEIVKKPGSKLLSGSFVVTGECLARLTHVGANSYVARLEAEAKAMSSNEQSEMVKGINRFVVLAGIAIVPIGIVLFVQGVLKGLAFSANVTSMVAAVVGMIPEGLYVLVSVTLAVSAANLARKKVMLHDMKSIETLARVDVLCVDKTGTITENTMVVEELVLPSGRPEEEKGRNERILQDYLAAHKDDNATMLAMRGFFRRRELGEEGSGGNGDGVSTGNSVGAGNGAGYDVANGNGSGSVAGTVNSNSNAVGTGSGDGFVDGNSNANGNGSGSGNGNSGSGVNGNGNVNALRVLPFSSKYKYSAATFPDGTPSGKTFVMGAPDIILAADYERWKGEILSYSNKGLRVLVFAYVDGPIYDSGISACKVIPLLFIILKNPIREGAVDTFHYFTDQGVTVKVISGDHPATVSHIAAQAGIPNADRAVDASLLKSKEEIEEAVENTTVFARVTPDKKQDIVKALQKAGHTVAMTGDGVNDIMAMKTADCSVAMASGSEAAVQASQVVLLDSDFSHMPQIVAEGRRVIGNIERSATLFLSKNMFSMLLAIFSIVNVLAYPLQPEQISLISGFSIGIPAFLLALEPNERRIRKHFMARVLFKALPASITDFVVVAALMIFGIVFGVSEGDISVASTFLLAVVGFMILYYISRPLSNYRILVIIVCIIGFCISAFVFHRWFGISSVSKKCMMLFVVFAIVTEPFMRYLTGFFGFLEKKLLNRELVKIKNEE